MEIRQFQMLGNGVQLVILEVREQRPGNGHCIHIGILQLDPVPGCRCLEEGGVKGGIVCHQDSILPPDEVHEHPQGFLFQRSIRHHLIGDAGELDHLIGDALLRIDEGVKFLQHFPVLHPDRADFGHALQTGGKAGGLQVEDDELAVKGLLGFSHHSGHHIVDQITLHAVEDLHLLARLFHRLLGIHGIGIGLGHTMVGDGNSGVTEIGRPLHQLVRRGHAVHRGHIGMQMQFHPLFLAGILPVCTLHQRNGIRTQQQFLFEGVQHNLAAG